MNATANVERQGGQSRNGGSELDSPPPLAGGGWGEGGPPSPPLSLLHHARSMRRAATPAEQKLRSAIRNHQDCGLKFRRQVPLGPYIADFYCPSARLVIEVDGISHVNAPDDLIRDEWMQRQGLRVLRISNSDVLSNLEGIVIAIALQAGAPPPPNPFPQGEGEDSEHV